MKELDNVSQQQQPQLSPMEIEIRKNVLGRKFMELQEKAMSLQIDLDLTRMQLTAISNTLNPQEPQPTSESGT